MEKPLELAIVDSGGFQIFLRPIVLLWIQVGLPSMVSGSAGVAAVMESTALRANHLDLDALGSEKREPEQNRSAPGQEERPQEPFPHRDELYP